MDSYPGSPGWQLLNDLSTVGAALIALGVLVFIVNVVVSLRHREVAGPDPWGGHTLEWAASSPPARHNFDVLPPIRSYARCLMSARPLNAFRVRVQHGERETLSSVPEMRPSGMSSRRRPAAAPPAFWGE